MYDPLILNRENPPCAVYTYYRDTTLRIKQPFVNKSGTAVPIVPEGATGVTFKSHIRPARFAEELWAEVTEEYFSLGTTQEFSNSGVEENAAINLFDIKAPAAIMEEVPAGRWSIDVFVYYTLDDEEYIDCLVYANFVVRENITKGPGEGVVPVPIIPVDPQPTDPTDPGDPGNGSSCEFDLNDPNILSGTATWTIEEVALNQPSVETEFATATVVVDNPDSNTLEYRVNGGDWQSGNQFSLNKYGPYLFEVRDEFFYKKAFIAQFGLTEIQSVNTSIVNGNLIIVWDEVPGAIGYNVYRDEGSGHELLNNELIENNSFTIDTVSSGTYDLQVEAIVSTGRKGVVVTV